MERNYCTALPQDVWNIIFDCFGIKCNLQNGLEISGEFMKLMCLSEPILGFDDCVHKYWKHKYRIIKKDKFIYLSKARSAITTIKQDVCSHGVTTLSSLTSAFSCEECRLSYISPYAIAIGQNNIALGNHAIAHSHYSVAIGRYP